MSNIRREKVKDVVVIVLLTIAVFCAGFIHGCAHTWNAAGLGLEDLGNATNSVGKAIGGLIKGVGKDLQDASSTQLGNSPTGQPPTGTPAHVPVQQPRKGSRHNNSTRGY